MLGLIGNKVGMTRFFTSCGTSIPITIIKILNNRIVNIINKKLSNYIYIQITAGIKKKNINKSILGIFNKNNIIPGINLWQFKIKKSFNLIDINIGKNINTDYFNNFKKVDVTGISIGKGFSGTIKKWGFKKQDASHGNSLSHRTPGSIGQNQSPGKVFKGKKMSGHYGNNRITIQNLNIVEVNLKDNLLIVHGSVPGNKKNLIIKPSIKIYK